MPASSSGTISAKGRARYETATESHHDHLINLRSGEVIEFRSDEIERLQAEVARKLGYKLVDHRLELYAVPLDDDKTTLMLRGLLIGAFFFTMTPLLISVQWLLDKLDLPGWGVIAVRYYRVLCRAAAHSHHAWSASRCTTARCCSCPITCPGPISW